MPMASQAMWRWAFAAEQRGELAPGTAARWAAQSEPFAALPAHTTAGAEILPVATTARERAPRISAPAFAGITAVVLALLVLAAKGHAR